MLLAAELNCFRADAPIILALPRGGVPVAFEIARHLKAPLDFLLVRKIGMPGHPEYGIGAVAEGGIEILDQDVINSWGLSSQDISRAKIQAEQELQEKIDHYRDGNPPLDIAGRTIIIVDDGLATGGTAKAAVQAAKGLGAAKVILAVPVGSKQAVSDLDNYADQVVCIQTPEPFQAVGLWYHNFEQVTDLEVSRFIESARDPSHPSSNKTQDYMAAIPINDNNSMLGDLVVPMQAKGLVIFAHGSGSSRHSVRNKQVAAMLQNHGIATLLIDLLSEVEETNHANVFDIPLLAERLCVATEWAGNHPLTAQLTVGYFGASTGGGAALMAAAQLPSKARAVVSRGGRPDLAGEALQEVEAPTLLIVGGEDHEVLALNRVAQTQLKGSSRLAIIPGATHLFEEPGTLDQVALLAAQWFDQYLAS